MELRLSEPRGSARGGAFAEPALECPDGDEGGRPTKSVCNRGPFAVRSVLRATFLSQRLGVTMPSKLACAGPASGEPAFTGRITEPDRRRRVTPEPVHLRLLARRLGPECDRPDERAAGARAGVGLQTTLRVGDRPWTAEWKGKHIEVAAFRLKKASTAWR